jgi:acetoacetyl-CoA synthetase
MSSAEVLWSPAPDAREHTRIGRYLRWLDEERGLRFADYDALWRWSVDDLAGFWTSIGEHLGVTDRGALGPALPDATMPGAKWFPEARLNYAEHALRASADGVPVRAESQTRGPSALTGAELRELVGRAAEGLRRLGIRPGDRVAGYVPNIPEALVAFLAAASLGAIWISCPPDFGPRAVVDRLGQVAPSMLIAVDGYRYGARAHSRLDELAAIRRQLTSVRSVILIPYLDEAAAVEGSVPWAEFLAGDAPLAFAPLPFAHPLYILFSSGTTGPPKPIVHGHGGILLEHLKALALHHDLGPGDRFFWFTTTGWMMWNYLVSGLVVGAEVVLFDGHPAHPDAMALWRLIERVGITYFGTSAPFILAGRKAGLRPGRDLDLGSLRAVGSTGAPLPAEGFRWVYEAVGSDLQLASISGGTDLCTAFVGASPLHPVRAGWIACRCLGAEVEAFDDGGRPVRDELGELVITRPMPSMPVAFWNDPDGRRLREAYFATYPGVWRHGDWIRIARDGSCQITGRSDATLNRGGVRLGTSEFYAVVEGFPEVADSLVVHLEDPSGGPGELLLFLVLREGAALDEVRVRIATELRRALSPRHVPDDTHAVSAVPRTLSGKKLEVPVKRILAGEAPAAVASEGALSDPRALDAFIALAGRYSPRLRHGRARGVEGSSEKAPEQDIRRRTWG